MKVGTKSQINEYMKIYEYPRSKSFTDLCPRSLRCHQFQTFLSNPTGPIEAEFHVEPPLEGETKICSNGPGHMTEMAAMPIYGKKLLKSSCLEPFDL